jgi:hypothetical protein
MVHRTDLETLKKFASYPSHFAPGKRNPPGIHRICGCVGHGAGVDLRIREKPLAPTGNKNPRFLVHQTHSLVTTLTELQSRTLPVSMLNTMKADRAGKHYFIYMCKLNTRSNVTTADKNWR